MLKKRLKKALIYNIFFLWALLLISCSHFIGARKDPASRFVKDTGILGTWWWWVEPEDQNSHLNFAAENGVNEIYYYTQNFDSQTSAFIKKARNRGIKVFLLLDDINYIWDYDKFIGIMNKYIAYQNKAPEKSKFAGLHLDLEPLLLPGFEENKEDFLQDYLDFVVWVCSRYQSGPGFISPAVTIDFDIPYWYDNDVAYRGGKIKLYQALIIEADRVFVMSYRDTAQKTYEASKKEVAFAGSLGKQIILGAETGRVDETPEDSYYGKGRDFFYEQLHELHQLVEYGNYGLSIHHIGSWYLMP